MKTPRRPKGDPTGGQFTPVTHSTANLNLPGPPATAGDHATGSPQPRTTPGDHRSVDPDLACAGASRDPDLPDAMVAELMAVGLDVNVRHDTLNRGGRTVLTAAAHDPHPAIRVAARGSPHLPAAARYALNRDLAVERLAGHQPIQAAS